MADETILEQDVLTAVNIANPAEWFFGVERLGFTTPHQISLSEIGVALVDPVDADITALDARLDAAEAQLLTLVNVTGDITALDARITVLEGGAVNPIVVVNDVATLAAALPYDGQLYQTQGYYTPADGGENLYRYDSLSVDAIDGGWVLQGPGGVGRFIALDRSVANVRQFGAVGDGVADDTSALQNAIDAATAARYMISAAGGSSINRHVSPKILLPHGQYLTSSPLIFDDAENPVNLVGDQSTLIATPGFAAGYAIEIGGATIGVGNINIENLHIVDYPNGIRCGEFPNNYSMGQLRLAFVRFIGMGVGTGLYIYNRSTTASLRDCQFDNWQTALHIESCDIVHMEDCRFNVVNYEAEATRPDYTGYVILNTGQLNVTDSMFIPSTIYSGTKPVSWFYTEDPAVLDVSHSIHCDLRINNCHFGGEGGGLTTVIWNAAPADTIPAYPRTVIVKSSWLANQREIGPALLSPVVGLVQIPNVLVVKENNFANARIVAASYIEGAVAPTPWVPTTAKALMVSCHDNGGGSAIASLVTPDYVPDDLGVATLADGDTTPAIAHANATTVLKCANTGLTSISNFDTESAGKSFKIFVDGNTTIVNGASIKLAGGANFKPGASGAMMEFASVGGVWHETSRVSYDAGAAGTGVGTVATVADLATAPATSGQLWHTLGYTTAGDGGANLYRYDSGSAVAVDGGWVILGPNATGRYLALNRHIEANVKQFGAAGDATTDDTAAIQAAINAATLARYEIPATGGSSIVRNVPNKIVFPHGRYVTSAPLIFDSAADPVSLVGDQATLMADPTFAPGGYCIEIGGPTTGCGNVTIENLHLLDYPGGIRCGESPNDHILGQVRLSFIRFIGDGTGIGLYIYNRRSTVSIRDCQFDNWNVALQVESCDLVSLSDTVFDVSTYNAEINRPDYTGYVILNTGQLNVRDCKFIATALYAGTKPVAWFYVTDPGSVVASHSLFCDLRINNCHFAETSGGLQTVIWDAAPDATIPVYPRSVTVRNSFVYNGREIGPALLSPVVAMLEIPNVLTVCENTFGSTRAVAASYIEGAVAPTPWTSTPAKPLQFNARDNGGGSATASLVTIDWIPDDIGTSTLINTDTTPDIAHANETVMLKFDNSAPTSVTNFDTEASAKRFIVFVDANTTLVNSASLVLAGSANFTPGANGAMMQFINMEGVWYEVSRSAF